LIHRDIKPANLWLEAPRGRVKILDFGLARLVHGQAPLTMPGTILGTPAYMSPEQINGSALDHRCDLFSLGCVLYLLCTGRLPFTGPHRVAVLGAILSADPPAPQEINPSVPAAFSKLVCQLLAKAPQDRPVSASAVHASLRAIAREQNAVSGAPIAAPVRPSDAALPQLAPLPNIRRTPARALIGVAVALLVGISGIALWQARSPDPIPDSRPPTVAKPAVLHPLDKLRPEDIPPDALAAAGDGDPKKAPAGLVAILSVPQDAHVAPVSAVDFTSDGRMLAFITNRGSWLLYDLAAAAVVQSKADTKYGRRGLGIAPGDKALALSQSSLELLELPSGTPLRRLASSMLRAVAFSRKDGLLATASADGVIQLWEWETGHEVGKIVPAPKSGTIHSLAFSPDGKMLAGGDEQGKVGLKLWDVPAVQEKQTISDQKVFSLAFRPDGTRLAAVLSKAPNDFSVVLWDLTTGESVNFRSLKEPIHHLAFRPDGKVLAAVTNNGVRFWDPGRDMQLAILTLRQDLAKCLAFSPDGRYVAIGTSEGTVYIFRLESSAATKAAP
jgi:hypothetical protein